MRQSVRWVAFCGWLAMAALAGFARAQTAGALELTSALGRKLYALPDDAAETTAKKNLAADPKNLSLVLALSKAQAARRQYKEAVATDTAGLAIDPQNADLLLERGHRELGLREFAAARKDLELATKVKKDMADAYYHLGLAHYFVGEFDAAAVAFSRARDLREKTDMDNIVDDTNWLYVSLRRAGQDGEAAEALTRVPKDTTATGHPAIYLRLVKLEQGQSSPQEAQAPKPAGPDDTEGELSYNTTSYGVGNWYLYQGNDPAKAAGIFRSVVQNEAWNSWGFIGSEVELGRK